jgi:acyl carrier protein
VVLEPSEPTQDAPCPHCGQLLWWLEQRLKDRYGITSERIIDDLSVFDDLDSLDTAELVMELEEEFDIEIPPEDAQKLRTVADAMRYIQERLRGELPEKQR